MAEKCWLNVFNNSPDSVQQNLKRYLNAIQAMGTGWACVPCATEETRKKQ